MGRSIEGARTCAWVSGAMLLLGLACVDLDLAQPAPQVQGPTDGSAASPSAPRAGESDCSPGVDGCQPSYGTSGECGPRSSGACSAGGQVCDGDASCELPICTVARTTVGACVLTR